MKHSIRFSGLCALSAALILPLRVAAAPQPDRVTVSDDAPAAVSQARPLGALSRTATVPLALTLPLRNEAALDDFLRRVADPRDPAYGHYLTPAEFAAQFGPTQADYDAVAAYARAQGLTVTGTHPNRLLLDVAGSPQAVGAAFGTRLAAYQGADGRPFYAPLAAATVPRALAAKIAGVVGLSSVALRQPHLRRQPDSATPEASVGIGTGPSAGLTPGDIRTAYGLSGLTLNGSGQTLAVFELDGYTPSDIQAYESHYGLPGVTLQNVLVDSVAGTPGIAADEVTLDIEMQLALAPGADEILVYECPNSDSGILDGYGRIADDDQAKEVSTSWGLDEQENDSNFIQSENTIFKQMAAQGQTIVAAAGDSGAYDSGSKADGLRVDDPASQPYVCSVGGTQLTNSRAGGPYVSETTWNDGSPSAGAGGGGISSVWPIPSWQTPVIANDSEASTTMRNVPDVALNAEPNTGYSIYYNGSWTVYGGASCAAPLWSGFLALVNQQRTALGLGLIGQADPALYAIAQGANYTTDFHDVSDDSNNLFYHAVPGYDLATGLGSFNGSQLLAALAPGTQAPVSAVASFPAGLNFFSLPYDYSGVSISTVFGYSPSLYAWSPTLLQYVLTPTAPADAVHLGQGYWVNFPSAVTVTTQGTAAPTDAAFAIPLALGWNMIGDPFPASITLSALQFTSGGKTLSFADAVTAGFVAGSLYRYDSGTGGYDTLGASDTLQPDLGYWIHAGGSVTLQVPHP